MTGDLTLCVLILVVIGLLVLGALIDVWKKGGKQ